MIVEIQYNDKQKVHNFNFVKIRKEIYVMYAWNLEFAESLSIN